MKTSFAIMGASGYVAPKHMEAIYKIGGHIHYAYDPHDGAGNLDKYWQNVKFFTEFELFYEELSRFQLDYMVICTPNYLHYYHIILALDMADHVICEKPLLISLDRYHFLEGEAHRISCILQLRHHPSYARLSAHVERYFERDLTGEDLRIELLYEAPRGDWYHKSWKGDDSKSGGLAFNIGIHGFDILTSILGPHQRVILRNKSHLLLDGTIHFERAVVKFRIAIQSGIADPRKYVRVGTIEFDFATNENLHNRAYEYIIAGRLGFTISDARPAMELAQLVQNL